MVKIPKLIRSFFPSVFWNGSKSEKIIYLTFDDGPTLDVTSQVLYLLKDYSAFATFFCLGSRVENCPKLFLQIVKDGHSIGNHSYNHYLGLRTSNKRYFEDVERANKVLESKLYRPPYGKMKLSQYRHLKKEYKIVLWDVIPGDYKKSMTVTTLINNVVNNVSSGSVVVLHDSNKCAKVMLKALPVILEILTQRGYTFESIKNEK